MLKVFYWTSKIKFKLTPQFSTFVKSWPTHWEQLTGQVLKKQQLLQRLVLRNGLQSLIVQYYQEELLNSVDFKLIAVWKVLTLIQRRDIILEVSSSFKLATLNKLKLVQSLDNVENYSLIFTKQEFPVVGSNLLTFEKLRDLSFQMLFKLILEPVLEVFADKNSYGFRKNRSSHQALANLGLHLTSLKNVSSSFLLLKGSLSHFSDKSLLRWILQRIPIPVKFRGLLLTWFNLKLIDFRNPYLQVCGIPRKSGILSVLITNFLLDGVERLIGCSMHFFIVKQHGLSTRMSSCFRPKAKVAPLFVSRFVHKLILGGYVKFNLIQTLNLFVTKFFRQRGIKFVFSTFSLVPGAFLKFSYLGYNFLVKRVTSTKTIKMLQKVKITPQRLSIQGFYRILFTTFQTSIHKSSYELILIINPLIAWWQSYFCFGLSGLEYRSLTSYLHFLCWKWIQRKHPKGNKNLLATYYFGELHQKQWIFRGFTKNPFVTSSQTKSFQFQVIFLKLVTVSYSRDQFLWWKLPEHLRSISAYSSQAFFVELYLYNQQLQRIFNLKQFGNLITNKS